MTITWDSYLPEVLPAVKGAPYSVAENAVRNAAIELCAKSSIWRETLTSINVAADTSEYTLTPVTSNTRIITVVYAEFDGAPIRPLSGDQLDHVNPRWRLGGLAYHYHLLDPTKMKLTWDPTTAITAGLVVRVSLKPTVSSTGADDQLYNDWHLAISCGAQAELFGMPKEEWTSATKAKEKRREFIGEISNANARASKGFTRVTTRVRMRPLA